MPPARPGSRPNPISAHTPVTVIRRPHRHRSNVKPGSGFGGEIRQLTFGQGIRTVRRNPKITSAPR